MKINVSILLFVMLISINLFSQTKEENRKKPGQSTNQPKQENEIVIYKLAMKYGDANIAIHSMYSLIARFPDSISYKDSLATIYFQIGSHGQCLRVCEEINTIRPLDTVIMRMMAMCYQSLGRPVDAINELEKTIKITDNVMDIYQKAAIEYSIKRLQESKNSVEQVITKSTPNNKIAMYSEKEKKQEVPLKAAAFNLYGMIAKDFNDTASARLLFHKAIEIYPEFYIANANLKMLDESSIKKPDDQTLPENKPASTAIKNPK